MIKFYLSILTVACCVFYSSLQAKELLNAKEQAFYAVSSLKFYINYALSTKSANANSNSEKIEFSEADLSRLWTLASGEPSVLAQVQQARLYYEEALSAENSLQLTGFCEKSRSLLETVWTTLNPYAQNKSTISSSSRGFFFYPNFDDNVYLEPAVRAQMRRYLLPLKHPAKAVLDVICNSFRILQNPDFFNLAGFKIVCAQPTSRIAFARHPALPGYVFKAYFDTNKPKIDRVPGWERLKRRCEGADNVRHLIKKKNMTCFSVPDKWLYPPSVAHVDPSLGLSVQTVLLMATDMDLVDLQESVEAWKRKATPRHLDELYCILSHGFASVFLPFNIPYAKNGKFSCVDTEDPFRKDDLNLVKGYLSPEMKLYWEELVKKGGKI